MQKNGILGIGVATMDIYVNRDRMYPGGNEYNVACNAKILGASAGRCSTVSLDKLKLLHRNGVDICYDFHAIYSEEEIVSISPYIKYGFFSCSHLTVPEIRDTLKLTVESGCRIAVGTRGADSIIAYDGNDWYEQETFPVARVADALGAGDSYIAAFLTSYLAGSERRETERIKKALEDAARHASGVIVKEGSIGIGFDRNAGKPCYRNKVRVNSNQENMEFVI